MFKWYTFNLKNKKIAAFTLHFSMTFLSVNQNRYFHKKIFLNNQIKKSILIEVQLLTNIN